MKIVFIDNFDSFTYNLIHYLQNTGSEVVMFHHNELFQNENYILSADAIVIGPGPNSPKDAGELMQFIPKLIEHYKPILGICLGQQALGEYFGMELALAQFPMHGKTSEIQHGGKDLFQNLQNPMKVGRYHSLVVKPTNDSDCIEVLAQINGEVMSIKHTKLPIWAVQFHPESVLTPEGQLLIQNWIELLN